MKSGYIYNVHPDEIEDNHDLIWVFGTLGNQRNPDALKNWGNLAGWKRGVIMQPKLSAGVGVNENASKFIELLNDLHYSDWNNGVPFIVDIYAASGTARFGLDHLRTLGIYITNYYNAQLKPLLRVNLTLWNAWMASNSIETTRLLQDFDILLTQWGVTKPATVAGYGLPYYWEYQDGMIKNDVTREWATDPLPPVGPGDPPPATGKQYRITVNGISFTVTVEAM